MKRFTVDSTDGLNTLICERWDTVGTPKAVLQIIHGMSEYIERYDAFASYMAENGVLVVGDNHLGHGATAKSPEDLGFFGLADGWINLIEDEEAVRKAVASEFPDTPYFMLGHSMGSFILRCYMSTHGEEIDGAIIMGTSGTNKAAGAGSVLARFLKGGSAGAKVPGKKMASIVNSTYVKGFPGETSPFCWLSADKENVEKYESDPMCGFPFTLGGYVDLFNLIKAMNSDECYERTPKDIPILVCSGADDPVGDFGKGVAEVVEKLQDSGCKYVASLLYEDMRHEILKEKDKSSVYEDMLDFVLDAAEYGPEEMFEEDDCDNHDHCDCDHCHH